MFPLIRKSQLNARHILLDCTWHFTPSYGWNEYKQEHPIGARFVDLERFSDPLSSFPHMMPSAVQFNREMSLLGLKASDSLVCYDNNMGLAASRVFFMLKVYGHQKVNVFDGSVKELPLTADTPVIEQTEYECTKSEESVIGYAELVRDMADYSNADPISLIDARSKGRFEGFEDEPRPGISSGHAPGSINIPYTTVLHSDGTFKSKAELEVIFRGLNGKIVTSCGSGVSAAVLNVALEIVGKKARLFDGSWTEYASYSSSQIRKFKL